MINRQFPPLIERSRNTARTLPAIFHLFLFIMIVMIVVLSLNFEILRVLRIGDLLILIFAFLVGVNWYGQKMQEEGYKNGIQKAAESVKNRKTK